LEITNLIVPGYNDSEEKIKELCEFVLTLGKETPLHFSRFFPHYKMKNIQPTPIEILEKAKKTAEDLGIEYVYIGNVAGEGEDTVCPKCKETVIKRYGFSAEKTNLEGKKCAKCGKEINLIL
jgi:pyruvate formate lyase activating enzyme